MLAAARNQSLKQGQKRLRWATEMLISRCKQNTAKFFFSLHSTSSLVFGRLWIIKGYPKYKLHWEKSQQVMHSSSFMKNNSCMLFTDPKVLHNYDIAPLLLSREAANLTRWFTTPSQHYGEFTDVNLSAWLEHSAHSITCCLTNNVPVHTDYAWEQAGWGMLLWYDSSTSKPY